MGLMGSYRVGSGARTSKDLTEVAACVTGIGMDRNPNGTVKTLLARVQSLPVYHMFPAF